MIPAILPGSYVEIRRTSRDAVHVGDIVLFRVNGAFRLHRLVDILPGPLLVTRGDNHGHNDPPERASELLGVAVEIRNPHPLARLARRLRHRFAS
jgi:hypothetical protein